MKQIDLYQVDAFTDRLFAGNPAAICPLEEWLPDSVMQSIAAENNLAETAFFIKQGDGYELRWFTTSGEINLCGHATLATAHVLFEHLGYAKPEIRFATRSAGPIAVKKQGDWLTLDFPAWIPQPLPEIPEAALNGVGLDKINEAYIKRDYLFVVSSEQDIRAIRPDFKALGTLKHSICVTAPGSDCDFVSRYFCPRDNPPEDPVTGSAHSMLIPYWAGKLGKTRLFARQLSERGGALCCELHGDRVFIGGQARTYMQGKIFLPD